MKVDEGWGGIKGDSYSGLQHFISDEEKAAQQKMVDDILTSGDWAAIHSWHVVTRKDGSKDVFDSMAFYHFAEQDGNLKVDKCWIKENS